MDLDAILKKTKSKANKQVVNIRVASIASEERPYDLDLPLSKDTKTISVAPKSLEKTLSTPSNIQSIFKNEDAQNHVNDEKINPQQSSNKPATNQQQISNKVATESATKWQQSSNQNISHKEKWQQSSNRICNKVATNWQQSGNKPATIFEIVGLQKNVLIIIYQECKKARSRITPALSLEYISSQLKTTSGSVRTTLQRLENKGCIMRTAFKTGRGGWSQYELLDQLYQELLQLENDHRLPLNFLLDREEKNNEYFAFPQQSGNKSATNQQQSGNKLAAQLATNDLSSSSIYNLTTTTENTENELNGDWQILDITPLKNIGFQEHHLAQIRKIGSLSAEQVQDSINAFAFDLENNNLANKLKSPPINFFMGIMRKKEPYVPPTNYEDPRTKKLRLYLEAKQAETKKKEELEKSIFLVAFKEWEEKLTEENVISIIPEARYREPGNTLRKSLLEKHFKETEWENVQKGITNAAAKV